MQKLIPENICRDMEILILETIRNHKKAIFHIHNQFKNRVYFQVTKDLFTLCSFVG